MKIHYICRGNVVRSLMAQAYTKSLQLPGIEATSSGTMADRHRAEDFTIKHRQSTLVLLDRHGLSSYIKSTSDQVSQEKIDGQDLVICVNQRAHDEAAELVTLPKNTIVWHIDDIGEGRRILVNDDRTKYEEAIFTEVKSNVDDLLASIGN